MSPAADSHHSLVQDHAAVHTCVHQNTVAQSILTPYASAYFYRTMHSRNNSSNTDPYDDAPLKASLKNYGSKTHHEATG